MFAIGMHFILPGKMYAQNDSTKQNPPPLTTSRMLEDYSYLKDSTSNPYEKVFGDELKYVALNPKRTIYLTFGGQYRARVEHYTNRDFSSVDETFFLQRAALYTSLTIDKAVRFFGEFYHGYTGSEQEFLGTEDIDWHQGFIEIKWINKEDKKWWMTFGRQEMAFGASRLLGIRDGPNVRRSFDLVRMYINSNDYWVQLFYGKEVNPQLGAFDNSFSLFDREATNPQIWGAYFQIPFDPLLNNSELYYIGFRSTLSGFSDLFGEEIRHTLGIRRFGQIGEHLTFNTELIYQFGELEGSTISAFNLESDWKYIFTNTKWKPTLGLKLDLSSGDREIDDGKLQSFNPLFVNPAIYSLAGVNTPVNLTNLHPNITFYPLKGMYVNIDYALFYRTSREDGLYAPPRFQDRMANGLNEKHIGDVIGLIASYQFNRNISFNVRSSYFLPGSFIEASGDAETTFFIAPTLGFKF